MEKPKDKSIFSNIYFWIAVLVAIVFIYLTITLSFMLVYRSRTDKADENKTTGGNVEEKSPTPSADVLKKTRVTLVKSSGWIDLDNRQITVVLAIRNLDAGVAREIARGNLFDIRIDDEPAKIINAEPVEDGFLTRAVSTFSAEKFGRFRSGASQSIEIKTALRYAGETESATLKPKFKKTTDIEVEGIKINWLN